MRWAAVWWVAVTVAVSLPGEPVRAASFVTLEDECRGRQLMIQGPVERGDYQRLVDALGRLLGGDLPDVQDVDTLWTVKLDSPGGDLEEAMRMGRLLRRAWATTEVSYRFAPRPDGVYDFARRGELVCLEGEGRLSGCAPDLLEAECAGACTLLWLAGAERFALEGRVGLHGLAGGGVAGYLAEMDVPPAWVARMSAGQVGDGWLGWPERKALSGRSPALTALAERCPAPLSADESFRSVTATDPALRERLLEQAERHRQCRREGLAEVRADTVAALRAGEAGVQLSARP